MVTTMPNLLRDGYNRRCLMVSIRMNYKRCATQMVSKYLIFKSESIPGDSEGAGPGKSRM